jgi:hypothetical protein
MIDETLETWADIADVYNLTGEHVSAVVLTQAQGIIDLFSGTTFAARGNLSQRNLRHLNRAVAYQAGWMPHHPDLFSHMEVESISQDGATATPANENARLLAPFAARCLKRLTWVQKPLRIRRRYGQFDDVDGPRDSAVADDNRNWTSMR